MDNRTKYNLFLFLSNLARNIIEFFSIVLLYEKGYDIKTLFLFLGVYYLVSVLVCIFSIWIGNKYNYNIILVLSCFLFGFSYYYLSVMDTTLVNILIFGVLQAISNYTYHSARHYFGISIVGNKKEVSEALIFTYIPLIFIPYVGAYLTNHFSLTTTIIVVIILLLVSMIPIFKIKLKGRKEHLDIRKSKPNNLMFWILEQFKVIFLLLEPLYLYIYIDNNLEYLGVFNIIIGLASLVFIYFIGRKKNTRKWFRYLNILFCLILVFKLNIRSKFLLYIVALLEGLGIKLYEMVSTTNLYNISDKKKVGSYLMLAEIVFGTISSIICFSFYLIDNLIISMYICILGIFLSAFVIKPLKNTFGTS